MRLLYSLVYSIALACVFPFEYRKRPRGVRRRWLREKLGRVGPGPGGPAVWVHAVSVGEVLAAEAFIKALKKKHPALEVVVSTITDTGQEVAGSRLGGLAGVVYMPFDTGSAMGRAIAALKPSVFIIMETELWPNAIWRMKGSGVPVVMLNGRISESSFKGYRKIRPFMRKVLEPVDVFCMQDEEYASRMVEMGAPREKVRVTGNFKFDVSLPGGKPPWGALLEGPAIVAGSTHRGEEALIISAYEGLKAEFGDLILIIAPRHPERFDEVEGILRESRVPYVRRSNLGDSPVSGKAVLLDTMGELSSVYSLCDVAVMGGSFIEHGGQNPLEPAYWGKPVVCGPHMENFPFVRKFYEAGAALEASEGNLRAVLRDLLSSPERRGAIGAAAAELLRKNSGAVQRAIEVVEGFLRV
ncbi:MAG: 3-deoxy-D-manno-octulosonic acid transferase [Nitrospirota bacterium]|jgi:3-deoxy-D-manno-octulosonic-acid transferase